MKIAIIYSTSNKVTKKTCEILSDKINADVQLIPIEMAKKDCLLKYNFIILASSAFRGKVQNLFKRYIVKNLKTLKEKPIALVLNCEEGENRFNEIYTEELVNNSYLNSNLGYEFDLNEGNFIKKRKMKRFINYYEKNELNFPKLNIDEINKFTDCINKIIDKRVD